MILKTVFSIKNLTVFGIAAFGLCFWAGDAKAQSEREKSEIEHERPIIKPLVENQSDQVDLQLHDNLAPASTTTTTAPSVKTTSPKKVEAQVSGEGKKVEPTPSTLSFNIFLYIVDKFKAD